MQRLLIANRGEIALRIARTASDMDIATLGIHAPEDADLAAGYGVDRLVALEGRGAASYLDIDRILDIARSHDCNAVHPGYGFLSESAAFARACERVGVRFVGPAPEALDLFGDKSAARAVAESQKVPIIPGIPAPASIGDVERFLKERPKGSGIMLKAVAGGGGRGMRALLRPEEIPEAFARCQSEASRSFGSDVLFAEALIEKARHIEIQIIADASGAVGHLWERDCSLQRRHQKLIEIAPSPGLDPTLRGELIEAARAIAIASNYVGIGTFEFLIDERGQFYFIEANPRLQVEHTITEAITGVDLVEVQLRLADGATLAQLGLAKAPAIRGHAIQLRVLAETIDAEGVSRPDAGRIEVFAPPAGPGIRVDSAMRAGLAAHPAFDSLIAKLIVSSDDPDFERCVRRARRALTEFRIEGARSNLDWLTALVERPEFAHNSVSTAFVAQHAGELSAAAAFAETARRHGEPSAPEALRAGGAGGAGGVSGDSAKRRLSPGALAIRSPLIGTVLEVCVAENDTVEAGQPIVVLESMKMEHVVEAARSGVVDRIFSLVGDVVPENEILASLQISDAEGERVAEGESHDLDRIRPDLAAMQARHALLFDDSRPEAVSRRRDRGQRTARENLDGICDAGSFVEYGALAVAAMRRVRPIEELQRKTPADAIITGFGTVNAETFGADRARCALLVVDATVLAGTQGHFHHHKIDRLLGLAERHGTPIVFFPEGGGGRPNDTDSGDLMTAGLNVTSFHAYAKLSGKVPRISIVSGFCFAGSAAFAGCSDVIIATKNTSLGMGGPAMIEGGGLGVYAPEDVGPAAVLEGVGVIDLLVEDEVEAIEVAKRYLAYFQGPLSEWDCADQRTLRHLIPENRRRVYDIRRVIETLCDAGSVLELRRRYGVGMITALVRIEGCAFGLLANDPTHLGGAVDDTGSEKAARFLQLCDAFGLPVLSLCDTPGFMVGPDIEVKGQVRKVSRLFLAGASLSVPLFTIILRKGYGLGAQAMAGGSFLAPAYIAAWPTGEIGGMGLEGAVRLGFKKQLESIEDEAERQKLFEKVVGQMYEKGKALNAASQLEFDAVIDPAETRSLLMRAVNAAGPIPRGTGSFVDTW
jgi:acetyl/propionyl-CoA carboxylase alpha subunit/acetyl-CoA carboxylase carboxyltransferase component